MAIGSSSIRPLVVKITCGAEELERLNQGLTVAATALATGFIAARYGLRPEPFYLGIAYAGPPWTEEPWRFAIAGNPAVSKPPPSAPRRR